MGAVCFDDSDSCVVIRVPQVSLIRDWRRVLKRAWSLKLIALAAILSGFEVAVQFLQDDFEPLFPKGVFAIIAVVVSIAAFVARLMAQKK